MGPESPQEDAMSKANYRVCMVLLRTAMLGGAIITMAGAANAEVVKLQADLKGSNEVPPNGSSGSGKAEATYDTETKILTYTVTFAGLTGPPLGAHFHGPGEAGKYAGIALPFKTVQSPIQGTATLTENQATDLLASKWYANIHTALNPGGELRGQMMK
jgi:hypothetical protein